MAEKLGLTHFDIPVVTVAGTNGKGSTIAAMEACYKAAGYVAGVYTSPHLLHFNERIRLNGVPVTEQQIVDAFVLIRDSLDDTTLSYFEYTTLAALVIFKQMTLDLILLEVGLGGRLDAVNVVEPAISVITTIHYDHQGWLGETRELIALEKAGIIRENKPVVVMETDIPMTLTQKIEALNAQPYYYQRDYSADLQAAHWAWSNHAYRIDNLPLTSVPLSNLATAIKVIDLLNEQLPVHRDCIKKGLAQIYIPGRCQILQLNPLVVLDVAHNEESAQRLGTVIKEKAKDRYVHVLFSALKDKELNNIVSPMTYEAADWHIAEIKHARAAEAKILSDVVHQHPHKTCTTYTSLTEAYKSVLAKAKNNDMIIVYGSFFTVSEILAEMQIKLYENIL